LGRQEPVNPGWLAADDNLPTTNSRTVGMCLSRKMEDGVKTGTKQKKKRFFDGTIFCIYEGELTFSENRMY
jgi:hypothetical protein